MNPIQQQNQHIIWLDVVRLIAMFMVVCCHCTDPFNFYPGVAP
ncbi:MAG: acyltransferase, partial [Bacteroides sp.]|nr:acyltransferase [Bacteroides sp.]